MEIWTSTGERAYVLWRESGEVRRRSAVVRGFFRRMWAGSVHREAVIVCHLGFRAVELSAHAWEWIVVVTIEGGKTHEAKEVPDLHD